MTKHHKQLDSGSVIPYGQSLQTLYEITDNQAEFLERFADTGSITKAAELTGISRNAHYDALRKSKSYAEAFRSLRHHIGDRILESIADRAINGDYIIYKGEIVKDPETGEPLRQKSDVIQIYGSKIFAGVSDQPTSEKQNSGPTVIINLPEQGKQQVIEVNEAENQEDT